jgi:prevent-host-death family protein
MQSFDLSNIRPLTDFRNNMKDYIKELNDNKKPIILTQHGKSAAVLLDAEKYQEIQDQLEFMRKVAVGISEYNNDQTLPFSEVFDGLEKTVQSSTEK